MKKHYDVKRFGKEDSHGWHREELVSKAREFLRLGGIEARRELVTTTLEIDRLLGEVRP